MMRIIVNEFIYVNWDDIFYYLLKIYQFQDDSFDKISLLEYQLFLETLGIGI